MKILCRSKEGVMQLSTKVYMGEGGSKSPKTCLRSLWMAPYRGTCNYTMHPAAFRFLNECSSATALLFNAKNSLK